MDRFVRGLLVVGGERGVITFKSASIAVTGTDQHHIGERVVWGGGPPREIFLSNSNFWTFCSLLSPFNLLLITYTIILLKNVCPI